MRLPPGSKPVRKSLEVHLVYFIEYGHHCLLNDLVLQAGDAQWSFPPIGLRDEHSPYWLCPVRSPVDPAVQIFYSILQPLLIVFPPHPVYSRRRFPLQAVKAPPQQIHSQVMQ